MKPLIHFTLAWVALILSIPCILWIVLSIHDGIHSGLFPAILLAITFLAIAWAHLWEGMAARRPKVTPWRPDWLCPKCGEELVLKGLNQKCPSCDTEV